ncbi:MAG: chemotaxis protein CheW, partial [Rectinema sp.]|nr:chemotaxis protein CheW [Rectinema sp.]
AHDMARALGKEVAVEIRGQEIELEKQLLEKLKDPLIHLLRNSIDHGIETPEERQKKGKKARGTVSIRVTHLDSKRIEIVVSDDGRGIDPAQLRQTIVEKGFASAEELAAMPEERLYQYLFLSGFSTSSIITDLSGRGLGLAIVKKAVDELEGTVSIESSPGQGTAFRLALPYSKASFRGNFIKVCNRLFAVPSSAIEQGLRVRQTDIQTAGNAELINYHGEVISIVHMADVLGIARSIETASPSHVIAIVCRIQERTCAFIVDEILGEQDMLIKPLGNQLQRAKGIYGATVIGDNEVVPILNMRDLVNIAFTTSQKGPSQKQAITKEAPKRVLVVEDSVTSRTLIKSILSAAGYQVQTATDGIEGFTLLKTCLLYTS